MKKLSRRNFIKGSLAGGIAAAATAGKAKKASAAGGDFGGYPDSMGVLVDLTKCVGCRTCEAACNKEQGLPEPDKPFDDYSVFDEHRHGGLPRRTSGKVRGLYRGSSSRHRAIDAWEHCLGLQFPRGDSD